MDVSDRNVDFQKHGRWSISKKKHHPRSQKKVGEFFCVFSHCIFSVFPQKMWKKIPTPKSRVFSVFKTVERLWLKKLQQSHEAQWICDGGCLDDIVEGAPKTNPWKQCPCMISLIFKKACNISQKDLRT